MTTGEKVRLVRTVGPAGNLLKSCLGLTGEVVQVIERMGKPIYRVRFRVNWHAMDTVVWNLKEEEIERA